MNCVKCARPLTQDEIALTRKLVNRGAQTFYCLDCLSRDFRVPVARLREMIETFRGSGCSLFPTSPPKG